MPRSYLDPPRPVFALATPRGASALALFRIGGPGCIEALARGFSRPRALLEAPGHSLVRGRILDPASGEALDDVLVSVFRAPRSPTGEDQAEISCHGSPAVLRRLEELLPALGVEPALPGEFSFRAFAAGKGDLVGAEAVAELVAARSEAARAGALRRLEGGLSRRLGAARAGLLRILAETEVRLDHAEEDGAPVETLPLAELDTLRRDLETLAASWNLGRLVSEGILAVIAGPPNAGKSSLFNLLLREERSLVDPEPGTTRDWIEAGLEVGGFPLRLVDTAGLREAARGPEARGVERARSLLAEADLVILVADACGPGSVGGLEAEVGSAGRPLIRAWNKTDLPEAGSPPAGWIAVSARSGAGLPALHEALAEACRSIAGSSPGPGPADGPPPRAAEDFIASRRQRDLLLRAAGALGAALEVLAGGEERLDAAALELREAAEALGELTGEIASAEVLEAIFSGFCLGK